MRRGDGHVPAEASRLVQRRGDLRLEARVLDRAKVRPHRGRRRRRRWRDGQADERILRLLRVIRQLEIELVLPESRVESALELAGRLGLEVGIAERALREA